MKVLAAHVSRENKTKTVTKSGGEIGALLFSHVHALGKTNTKKMLLADTLKERRPTDVKKSRANG